MTKSFFPWMGGKSRLAKTIIRQIPDHACYCEVFAGAANILFAKPPSKSEVLNDINGDLITLFRVVKHHRREFLRQLLLITHSRQDFDDFKSQRGQTDIQQSARFYMILKAAFGGKGGDLNPTFGYGTTGKARFSRTALAPVFKCHKRLSGVTIENTDFQDIFKRYDRKHTFFYCDPPYYETAGYAAKFTLDHQKQLADILKSIKGKFLLSINDHPTIRKLYKGCQVKKLTTKYTVARDKTAAAQPRGELLIANYRLNKIESVKPA